MGGAGFLGSHLTEALLAQGRGVRVFDREKANLRNVEGLAGDWEFQGGDFANEADLTAAVAGVTTVFHLISTTIPASSNQNPIYDVETNLVSTLRLLEASRREGVRSLVFLSSGGTVYGRPRTLPIAEDHPTEPRVSYGAVKLAIEKYLRLYHHLHGLNVRILRLSNPYGPRQETGGAQGAASVFLGRVLRDEPITIWGDGSVVRDYIYVADSVEAMLAAERTEAGEGVWNIGSGTGVSLRELVSTIQEVVGREVQVDYKPGRPFDVPENVLDVGLAGKDLGWVPRTDLATGLRKTWDWLQATASP